MGQSPFRLAAGALGEVTQLRFDNANVTLRQRGETAITIPLIKTLLRALTASDAGNLTTIFETKGLPEQIVQRQLNIADWQAIRYRRVCGGDHFAEVAVELVHIFFL